MTDQPMRHVAGEGKLHYDRTIVPRQAGAEEDDTLSAAAQIVRASTDLMLALERMPGPIWAVLNDRHAAEHHTPDAAMLDCVPCQFDKVLAIHKAYDPLAKKEHFRDPAELFDQLVGRATPSPTLQLKGTRTGRITVEDDGTQIYSSEFGHKPPFEVSKLVLTDETIRVTPHVEVDPGLTRVWTEEELEEARAKLGGGQGQVMLSPGEVKVYEVEE